MRSPQMVTFAFCALVVAPLLSQKPDEAWPLGSHDSIMTTATTVGAQTPGK